MGVNIPLLKWMLHSDAERYCSIRYVKIGARYVSTCSINQILNNFGQIFLIQNLDSNKSGFTDFFKVVHAQSIRRKGIDTFQVSSESRNPTKKAGIIIILVLPTIFKISSKI